MNIHCHGKIMGGFLGNLGFFSEYHGLSRVNHGFVMGSSRVVRGLNPQPELLGSQTLKKSFWDSPSFEKDC